MERGASAEQVREGAFGAGRTAERRLLAREGRQGGAHEGGRSASRCTCGRRQPGAHRQNEACSRAKATEVAQSALSSRASGHTCPKHPRHQLTMQHVQHAALATAAHRLTPLPCAVVRGQQDTCGSAGGRQAVQGQNAVGWPRPAVGGHEGERESCRAPLSVRPLRDKTDTALGRGRSSRPAGRRSLENVPNHPLSFTPCLHAADA